MDFGMACALCVWVFGMLGANSNYVKEQKEKALLFDLQRMEQKGESLTAREEKEMVRLQKKYAYRGFHINFGGGK